MHELEDTPPGLPPYSGRKGRCPKCRSRCATTKHLTAYPGLHSDLTGWITRRDPAAGEPYRGYLEACELTEIPHDGAEPARRNWTPAPWWPPEWLNRCCLVCTYRWDEALASQPSEPASRSVRIPREVLAQLTEVAAYVSLGRHAVDHQPDGAPYPDSTARFALGALSDLGLRTYPEAEHG